MQDKRIRKGRRVPSFGSKMSRVLDTISEWLINQTNPTPKRNRAFLCGRDAHTGQNFEHRRAWIRDRLRELAGGFAVEVLSYSAKTKATCANPEGAKW